jgi:organic radical activating enzyme
MALSECKECIYRPGDAPQEFSMTTTQVAEWAKQFDVGFSPRMHLLLWNKALLV